MEKRIMDNASYNIWAVVLELVTTCGSQIVAHNLWLRTGKEAQLVAHSSQIVTKNREGGTAHL